MVLVMGFLEEHVLLAIGKCTNIVVLDVYGQKLHLCLLTCIVPQEDREYVGQWKL